MNINRFKSRVGLCELREVALTDFRLIGHKHWSDPVDIRGIAEKVKPSKDFVLHGKPYSGTPDAPKGSEIRKRKLNAETRSPAEQAAYNKAKNKEERDRMAKTIRTSRANVRAGKNRRSALAAGVPGALAAGAWMANQDSVEESCKSRIASLRESSIIRRVAKI